MSPCPEIVFYRLQHHNPLGKRGPARRHLIRFRKDGSLFNPRRLLTRTKTIEELITKLLFVVDCALLVHKKEALQHVVNRFFDAPKNFGLIISLKKTDVLPTPSTTSIQSSSDRHQWRQPQRSGTLLTWVASSPVMPQSSGILTTACPKPAVPSEDSQSEYSSHSLRLTTKIQVYRVCLLYTSPSPRDCIVSRMPSSA